MATTVRSTHASAATGADIACNLRHHPTSLSRIGTETSPGSERLWCLCAAASGGRDKVPQTTAVRRARTGPRGRERLAEEMKQGWDFAPQQAAPTERWPIACTRPVIESKEARKAVEVIGEGTHHGTSLKSSLIRLQEHQQRTANTNNCRLATIFTPLQPLLPSKYQLQFYPTSQKTSQKRILPCHSLTIVRIDKLLAFV
jgi:hypothetical protein